MFPARRLKAAAPWLVAAAMSVAVCPVVEARAETGTCRDVADIAVLPTPAAPWKGSPLRVILAAETPIEGELTLVAPDGSIAAKSRERHGGPPYFWYAEVTSPSTGTWHATLVRDGAKTDCGTITRDITVRETEGARPRAVAGSVWPIHNEWNRQTENLFSAWIEKLFDAPLEASPSWSALHEVLRDRSRNVLFNYLGLGEDEMGMILRPDCADLPYFLRAYFAFKMGLPFGYSMCTRGVGQPPKCPGWFNIQAAEPARSSAQQVAAGGGGTASSAQSAGTAVSRPVGLAASFGRYVQVVANTVQSASGRTRADDDKTDYYPVSLTQETLRPGTIYADPYGHILMLVKRVPQSADGAGVFLAVDGQPDGTVARKRFWRGNFLFAQDPAVGSPGFKRFRPIMREKSGTLRRLTNAEIARNAQYGDFSMEQTTLSVEEFYDRMDDVMSPAPLDPVNALKEAITSLDEQVHTRVISVENGRKFQNSGKGEAAMPDGPAIFETIGAWEDFATPSRDLRLLIAIDVVKNFPDRVARRPERYAMPKDKSVSDVKAELDKVLASELATRKFAYARSDGSPWTLTMQDVVDRAPALEMAYNVNDCVELRWGAPEKSEEAATCKRHAPVAQRNKMTNYRAWFRERRRPARG